MPRRRKNARKIYTISLYKLQQQLELTTVQRVKVGKFIEKVVQLEHEKNR
jgi:hypothetical protein